MGFMLIQPTAIAGLYEVQYQPYHDHRGAFVKTIHRNSFENAGLHWCFEESYFSVSAAGVIRGMHFQLPPAAHDKLVYVVNGSIQDVVLDLRQSAPTYGSYLVTQLSAANRKGLYIAAGLAHGFISEAADTVVEYHTTTAQDKAAEAGVLWNSFGYKWPVVAPVLSDRDRAFPAFDKQQQYFI